MGADSPRPTTYDGKKVIRVIRYTRATACYKTGSARDDSVHVQANVSVPRMVQEGEARRARPVGRLRQMRFRPGTF